MYKVLYVCLQQSLGGQFGRVDFRGAVRRVNHEMTTHDTQAW